jgi:hypothetical protein
MGKSTAADWSQNLIRDMTAVKQVKLSHMFMIQLLSVSMLTSKGNLCQMQIAGSAKRVAVLGIKTEDKVGLCPAP